jgi:uncharacterized membrane protein YdjX (TVP38/TMEM64 family)
VGDSLLAAFITVVEQVRGEPWAFPAFLAAFALSCQGLPTMIFPVAGGILFGFTGGVAANVLGFTLGSTLTFFAARRWGRRPWVVTRTASFPEAFRRPGFWLMLVVRLTGFPPLLVANLLAGVSEMRYAPFAAATLLGVAPWSCLMAFFSDVLWEALRTGGMASFKDTLVAYARPLAMAAAAFGTVVGVAAWAGKRLLPQGAGGGKVRE